MSDRKKKLHVVTCRSNPFLYNTPQRIFEEWVHHMLHEHGVNLTVIELQYGDRPFRCHIEGVNHIGVRAHSVLWAKENLHNIAMQRIPDWENLAWIDSDVFFSDKHWAEKTVEALQFYDIIQPWKHCYDLGPEGEHMQLHQSFCSLIAEGKKPQLPNNKYGTFGHPGYAWAATRSALERLGGLIETAILGSADHHMALALIGKAELSYPAAISESYKEPVLAWQERASKHICQNIGYLKGTIHHKFHGDKALRHYQSRWNILVNNKFNVHTDIKKNTFGVFNLTGNKPNLRREIMSYFGTRNEDMNIILPKMD